IEQDPLEQGYEPHSFDLILASDVLHATASLRDTLGRCLRLLSSEGLLILVEGERELPSNDLVFGLLEGWWRFRDYDLRPDHPLVRRATWKRVLEEVGFTDVADVSLPQESEECIHVVMLARGPRIRERAEGVVPPLAVQAPAGEKGRWLIFADGGGVAEKLVELLAFHGEACLRARPGGGFRRIDDEDFEVCPDDRGDMERLLEVAVASRPGTAWRGAIHLWSLDTPPPDETSLGALQRAEVLGCHSVMHFLQALHRIERVTDSPRLLLVTRGAQPVGEATEPVAIAQSALLGLGRVIINEHPDIRCKLVDLGPCDDPEEIQSLLAELETDDPEEEVALRCDARFVPRVARAEPERAPARRITSAGEETAAFRLELSTPGVIDSLTLSQAERRRPGRGQVEIEVCAAALNFRDIMKVLRLYPADDGDEMLLGDECAGRIVALGEGVEGLHIGDEVIAMTPGSFGSHVTAPAGLVMRKPERLTFEEAVTMPAAFLTASYALHHLARLRRGERVLIHAATGGVGLAALQIARHLGAEIFATAGSPEKRELLRLLGVQHVMDSRSLAFADQVMEITGGRGVDVVLNSLAGQALAKGVSCLAPFGRFLELGKRDLYQNSKLGLWGLRKGASFFAVDVSLFAEAEDHAVARSLLDELSRHIQEGTFHPLPHRVVPVSRAVDAFRHMAQARHVGKVVISMQEGDALVREVNEKTIAFRPDRTYLITGGFGGLGLTVAGWIIDHGGRNVVLMSRGGAASPEARKALERLREAGARVVAVAGDVSSERQVADALAAIDGSMPPLGGIFHAAMVLDDGVLLQLDRERFRKVMAPKADGAWNLHAQTLDRPLDHFVLFSSFTGLVGNPGQGNYVAASAFLDAFAHYRRSLGRPAITINWGAVAEAGYVARHAEISRLMERRGITALSLEQAMEALGCILRKNPAQLGVIRTNWQQGAGFAKVPRRLSALLGAARIDEHRGEEGSGIRDALAQGNPEEREAIARTYVREQVARVLGASPGTLEVDRPLGELGLDSLRGVELRNRVESDLALSLSVRELMQNPTINSLARALVERLAGRDAASAGTPTTETSQPGRRQRGPSMSGLVPLRAQGMRPPLFCIHPAGGQVSIYKHLVEMLPTDQPVYGIQSRLNAGFDEEHDSIEDMAIEYARVIRQQQASGGVHLLGFSVGGFIAMAVANVLERQGQHLGFVGLVDCDFAWAHPSYPKRQVLQNIIMETYGLLERELGVLRPLPAERLSDEAREVSEAILLCGMDERVEAVITWLTEQKHIEEDIPYGTMTQYLSGFFRRFEIHTSLISKFEPRMIRAPVSIWWAREGLSGTRQAERHWGMYTSGGVVEGTIEGSHYAVMYPPAVSTLAAELDKSLRGVQG
ncbi:MAG: SDR family NAD(P)-dependent oxidoreductase, partial [Candidatus Rokubacteria bacterium]|nr:SDR family NAD(P)-dependent oxidoreductase [Candidatus Rokubacteria bacterium]